MAQAQPQSQRLAPSVRRAQDRVTWAWYGTIVHAVLLLGLGIHLLTRSEPAWVLGILCLAGVGAVPFLGQAVYRGSAMSALVLLASVLAPPVAAFFLDRGLLLAALGLPLAVAYYWGVRGATGLRGKRSGRRGEARPGTGIGGSGSRDRDGRRRAGAGKQARSTAGGSRKGKTKKRRRS